MEHFDALGKIADLAPLAIMYDFNLIMKAHQINNKLQDSLKTHWPSTF